MVLHFLMKLTDQSNSYNAMSHARDFDLAFNKSNRVLKKQRTPKPKKEGAAPKKRLSEKKISQCQECFQFYHNKVFDVHANQCRLLRQGFATDMCNESRIQNNVPISICSARLFLHKERKGGKDVTTTPQRSAQQGPFNQQYERAWKKFEDISLAQSEKRMIGVDDIPFLPILSSAKDGSKSGAVSSSSVQEERARLRSLLVRWHPDHFLQRFGPRLSKCDIPIIKSRLNDTIRYLYSLKVSIK